MHAQALEPRSYANTTVGINFMLLSYGYTKGDVGFDASSRVTDAKVHVHAGRLLAHARSPTRCSASPHGYGAPALSMADFPTYRPDVIVGVSLQVTAPLWQYDSSKLLNVGTNRWSFYNPTDNDVWARRNGLANFAGVEGCRP